MPRLYRTPLETKTNREIFHRLNQAAQVVSNELRRRFVAHRQTILCPDAVAELL
jgi:hypothetical protein